MERFDPELSLTWERNSQETDRDFLKLLNEIEREQEGSAQQDKDGSWTLGFALLEQIHLLRTVADCRELYVKILDGALNIFRAERGALALKGSDKRLRFEARRNSAGQSIPRDEMRISKNLLVTALETRELAHVEDILIDAKNPSWDNVRQFGLLSAVCCPMIVSGEVVGIIYLESAQPLISSSRIKKLLLQFYSDSAGEAIRGTALRDSTKESARKIRSLKQQLIHHEKLAVKGQIALQIGHEINNLLSALHGNIEIALHGLDGKCGSAEVAERLRKAMENMNMMSRYSRGLVEGAQVSARKETLNINDVIGRFIPFIGPFLESRGARLDCDLEPGLPALKIDAGLMQGVLLNLIKNAAEAKPDNVITVRTRWCKNEQAVRISVADRGPGMDSVKRRQVFIPHLSDKADGHGFGLNISRMIIRGHGGELSVQSEPGQGTEMIITLPLVSSPSRVDATP